MCRLLYQFFGKIVHKLYSSVGYLQYYSQTIRSMPTTVQIYFRQFVVCNKPYLYVPITCTAILDTTKYTKWSIVSILNYLKSKQNICVHVMDNLKADLQYVHTTTTIRWPKRSSSICRKESRKSFSAFGTCSTEFDNFIIY